MQKQKKYSGISLVRSARYQDFLYRLNVVHTKRCDCVRIFSLPYADLYNRINIACLTVPSTNFGAWFRRYFQIYKAPSHKYSVADIHDGFKKVINGNLLIFF